MHKVATAVSCVAPDRNMQILFQWDTRSNNTAFLSMLGYLSADYKEYYYHLECDGV